MTYKNYRNRTKIISLHLRENKNKLNIYLHYLIQKITPFGSLWNNVLHQIERFSAKKLHFNFQKWSNHKTQNRSENSFIQKKRVFIQKYGVFIQ